LIRKELIMKRPYIVSIEGNIGSGKTTLMHRLEERFGDGKKFMFLREPLHIWKSIQDRETSENILEKFYKDTTKYAFSFQIMVYITFSQRLIDAIKESDENTVIVCERSLESCRSIFAKMLRESGNIDDINYKVLEMFYNQVELIHIDAVIYLDISVETSDERIKKRARLGEKNIPLSYLEKCRKSHEDWLRSITSNQLDNPIPLLTLNESMNDNDMIERINIFIMDHRYKLVGLCEGCNFEKKIYSDEEHYFMRNYDLQTEKLLCKKCFDGCWRDAIDEGWKWDDEIHYTGEEYETDSIGST
jgi:deoxynucleoside kinase